jgi:hypothetical protein
MKKNNFDIPPHIAEKVRLYGNSPEDVKKWRDERRIKFPRLSSLNNSKSISTSISSIPINKVVWVIYLRLMPHHQRRKKNHIVK